MVTEESDSLCRMAPGRECNARKLPDAESMDVRELDASALLRTLRPVVLMRSTSGDDCVGRAVSLSELVRLDDEEWDSAPDIESCTREQCELHSPFSLSSPLSEGKGMEFERLGGEGRPGGGSESAGVDIVSS